MPASHDFTDDSAFTLRMPAEPSSPLVFNSPHSGAHYPRRFLDMSRLDALTIRRSEDCHVDRLFAGVVAQGAPLLEAHFPRAYLDANREPFELDPRMYDTGLPPYANTRSARVAGGLGTVPRLVGEGQEIYGGRIALADALSRIDAVYKPYHKALSGLLAQTQARFGIVLLVDCHSMPGTVRVGESRMRPDFIIGDRFGMACAADFSETAISLLARLGYTVAHNRPYAGGFITEHYGRPARGVHALQIEINRSLYMDERTLEPNAGYEQLATDIAFFSRELIERFRPSVEPLPVAAE